MGYIIDIYFGLVDFNPETVQFPLSIKAYRLGDYLGINADALFKLPGSGNITITVSYSLAPLNLNVTRAKPWNPASTFGFNDIFYDGAVTDNHVYSLTSLVACQPYIMDLRVKLWEMFIFQS
jgi:hypothetical protein